MVAQSLPSWNRVREWLSHLDDLRTAFGGH